MKRKKKRRNMRRLLAAAERLEALGERTTVDPAYRIKFDMSAWGVMDSGQFCAVCALGLEVLQGDGPLQFDMRDHDENCCAPEVELRKPRGRNRSDIVLRNYDAAAEFYGIHRRAAVWLFHPFGYPSYPRTKPHHVAARIREVMRQPAGWEPDWDMESEQYA